MAIKLEQILDASKIEHCTQRITYQIYESNIDYDQIVLVGIKDNGFIYAEKIKKYLEEISPLSVQLIALQMDKKKPRESIKINAELDTLSQASVVLVDDVLNTGKTLLYAVKHLLEVPLKQLKTVVLVDRNHKKFPVKADFKGISLSTSLNEHVEVVFTGKDVGVYLS